MILAVTAGLVLSGSTPRSYAAMPSAEAASPHDAHQVQRYADLAIEAGEPDCPHAVADAPAQHSHDDGLCKKFCAACTTANLVPDAPAPMLSLSGEREIFPMKRHALVAHTVPTDPGIPKSL
jgi:hypothetical protein